MADTADLIVTRARVLTMDPDRPRAEAVAVRNGRVLAVGSDDEIASLAAPNARRIDGRGATLLPGFSESHMHLFAGAGEMDHLQLAGVEGLDALAAAIRRYAAEHPADRVLLAQGADYAILGPGAALDRHVLDGVLADRPLMLVAPDHHTAWANTAALALAGLLDGAVMPRGHEVVMGADGRATGELREMSAFDPVLVAAGVDRYRLGLSTGGEPDPWPTGAEWERDLDVMRRGLAFAARHGITSIHNMDGNLHQLELLRDLEQRGELACRVKVPYHWKPGVNLCSLDRASAMARDFAGDMVTSGFVKVFYDGVIDSGTAVMLEPYADQPGWCGEPLLSPAEFRDFAVEADRRGLQIAVHAIGDGAVRAVLDGYEAAARANGRRDSRHRIEHIEVVHPDDIPRFRELGVVASMQPPHPPGAMNFPLEPTVSRIGRSRWPLAYAWRTLKEAGAHVVFASDWPVSPIDPMAGVKAAVTRRRWSETDPDQSFSLMEALAAYTAEGAYVEFKEDRKGRLKPGFLADMVLLSDDVEAVAPEALDEVRPVATICAGRIAYEVP
jgi:predicted amidohydrolase YtcJ